jgi:murein DD-endopeptidase MepM/ murein hydrolase activator NlpD
MRTQRRGEETSPRRSDSRPAAISPAMRHIGATAKVTFLQKGTYRAERNCRAGYERESRRHNRDCELTSGAVRAVRQATAACCTALFFCASASAMTDAPLKIDFVWPADGTITSPFGSDFGRWHPGLDIGMLRSLTVRAAAPGVVTQVGTPYGYDGYGNVVVVRMSPGFDALYAHLALWHVRVGENVFGGEPIAVAGCTGWCTGTHLHFELREAARPVDPTPFLR